jgi:hypothetical protein
MCNRLLFLEIAVVTLDGVNYIDNHDCAQTEIREVWCAEIEDDSVFERGDSYFECQKPW